MLIGIDETGNFDPNSTDLQFFTAIAVDQNAGKHLIKEKQFLDWESTIPERNRDQKTGELKGRCLLPNQIHEFFYEVLLKPPRSYFTALQFDPVDNPAVLIEKHKHWNLGQLTDAMTQRRNAGQPNWTKRYNEFIAWYKKSNYQRVVKIESLQNLYCFAFNQAFFYSQILCVTDNFDDSNFNLQFKIDRDFVRSPFLRNFWDVYLYKFWDVWVETNPALLLETEPKVLEVLKKKFNVEENRIMFHEPFYSHTNFVDSKDHFEVRMADIFGNILHRYHNKGQCEHIWNFVVEILKREKIVPLYSSMSFEKGDPPS